MDETLRVEQAMQAVLDDYLDDHARRITERWRALWADLAAEFEAALYGQVGPGNVDKALPLDPTRVRRAMDIARQELDDAIGYASDLMAESVPDIVDLGITGQGGMYRTQGVVEFNRADSEQITAMVQRSVDQITSVAWPIAVETHDAIAKRLNRGVAVGDNPRLVAEQIMRDVEGDINMSLARAVNISRTEMLDAMRTAQYTTDLLNSKVLRGWVWNAHLDSKTCASCIAMHGREFPVEEPGPLDHHSGRCARVPLTRSWEDLGFKGIPDTNPVLPDAMEWFTSLPEEEQRGVLGRRGYRAWKAGVYPPETWPVLKDNKNWRPAYFVNPPPKEF